LVNNNQFFGLNIDIIVSLYSNWLKSAVDARISYGTVASLTKLNTDISETTERISEEAVGVCSTWSAGKKTLARALAVALRFAFEYTTGGRAPALSLVVSLLTVL